MPAMTPEHPLLAHLPVEEPGVRARSPRSRVLPTATVAQLVAEERDIRAKRRDVLAALVRPDRPSARRGGWMTTGEVHAEMGRSPRWTVRASWLNWMVEDGWAERRPGKRRQYRASDEGRAELARLDAAGATS